MEAVQEGATEIKILHIYNTAGVASILAKFIDEQFGTESSVVVPKMADPWGLTTYGEVWDCGLTMFKLRVTLKARNYDVLHCHSVEGIARWLKHLFPRKVVVFHFHGSDIRGKWQAKKKFWNCADAIIVSTSDLLENSPKGTVYLPTPVDIGLFHPQGVHEKGTSLHFSYGADDLARELAERHNLKLTICNRVEQPIAYVDMPTVLGNYEFYIDVKRSSNQVLEAMSKTGYEALACGCKVIDYEGVLHSGLPIVHNPENVTKTLYGVYYDRLFKK